MEHIPCAATDGCAVFKVRLSVVKHLKLTLRGQTSVMFVAAHDSSLLLPTWKPPEMVMFLRMCELVLPHWLEQAALLAADLLSRKGLNAYVELVSRKALAAGE